MNISRYPKYKNSHIDWIGDIPETWNIDRIKASVKSCNNGIWGDEPIGDSNDIVCVRVADFNRDTLSVDISNPTLRNISDREKYNRILKKDDLLVEKSGGGENQLVGCIVLYEHENSAAVCSNFIARLVLKDGMVPSFWKYLHFAAYSIKLTIRSINQTSGIQNLDQDRYFNEKVAFPPFDEQQAIANFLDHETEKINHLIQKQEKLIELIEEERKAVISEAVSKGLDNQIKLKDSDILWLGKIPIHWNIRPLKYLISFNDEVLPESTPDDYEIRYVEVGDISEKLGILNSTDITFKDAASRARRLVKHGDILISTVRTYLRAIAPVSNPPSNMVVSTGFAVIRPKSLNNDYARFLLSTEYFLSEVISRSTGVSYPAINASDLVQIKVPVPPIDEQEKIAKFIKKKCESIDILIKKSKNSIELLKEHRASLISALVTGKINVRKSL